MKSTPADKAFLHELYMRHYAGLCRACRGSEFQKIQAQPLPEKERCASISVEEEGSENDQN